MILQVNLQNLDYITGNNSEKKDYLCFYSGKLCIFAPNSCETAHAQSLMLASRLSPNRSFVACF